MKSSQPLFTTARIVHCPPGWLACGLTACLLAGCASERMPMAEAQGRAARAAWASQVINPQAGAMVQPAEWPGRAAKGSIDRYVRTFEVAVPAGNQAQGAAGTGAGSGSAPAAAGASFGTGTGTARP